MARLPLVGGAYYARSVIGNAQRSINYFPELNRRDAPVPMTHYQRPGLVPRAAPAVADVGRCLYQASNGNQYCVIGSTVYSISAGWVLAPLGAITPGLTNPVSMIDNGTSVVIVDGSVNFWTILLATNVFALGIDATGNFAGGTRTDVLDTFIVWNKPSTNKYGATFSNVLTTNGLSFGAKATHPDPIVSLLVRRTEIVILGTQKGEIHYNVGGAIFPFARLPGSYIEYGLAAAYSLAASDISIFWLSKSLEGDGRSFIMRLKGYDVIAISNPAIADAMSKMSRTDDAVAYCYQQAGHSFYVISFPSGDQTWVFDDAIADPMMAWHQRAWTDSNGVLHRVRDNAFAVINGVNAVIDWENGTIYEHDPFTYTDTVADTVYGLSCIRSFPHLTQAYNEKGELEDTDGKSVLVKSFVAQMQCGTGARDVNGDPAKVALRWSPDYGVTWLQAQLQTAGAPGEYRTDPMWPSLGTEKHWVFELSHSINGPAALNGAWIDAVINAR